MVTNGIDLGGHDTSTFSGGGTSAPLPGQVTTSSAPGVINPMALGPGLGPRESDDSGFFYAADGGAIDTGDGAGQDDSASALGSAGLNVVRQVLDYGRQKHGLTDDQDDQGKVARQPFQGRGFVPNSSPDYDGSGQQYKVSPGFISPGLQAGGEVPELEPQQQQQGAIPEIADTPAPGADGGSYDVPDTRPWSDRLAFGAAQMGSDVLDAIGGIASQAGEEFKGSGWEDEKRRAKTVGSALVDPSNYSIPAVAGNFNRIIGYLSGEGAAAPQQVQQIEQQVDPNGQMDPGERKLAAIQAAAQQAGAQGGWPVLQHYRKAYDHSKAFAAAAADQGHLPSAARAASMAFDNLPDGNKVTFTPGQGGFVTATITGRDGESSQIQLSPKTFSSFMKGGQSQFDNVIENGPAKALASIGQPDKGAGQETDRTREPGIDPNKPYLQIGENNRLQRVEPGAAAGPNDKPITSTYAREAQQRDTDERTIRTSHEMFPTVGMNKQRLDWIEKQRQQGEENKAAQIKAENVLKVADTKRQSALEVARERTSAATQVKEMAGKNMLAAIEKKDKGTQQRFLLDQLGKDRRVQMSNAGRALEAAIKDPSKGMDDYKALAKSGGTSLDAIIGHAQTMNIPGMGDDAVPFITAPQTIGAAPSQQIGAAPTQGSTQLPNIGGRQFYKGSDGKAHWVDNNELVQAGR